MVNNRVAPDSSPRRPTSQWLRASHRNWGLLRGSLASAVAA